MEDQNLNNELIKSVDQLKEEFSTFKDKISNIQDSVKRENKKLEKPFEMLNLPSKGFFYKNKNSFILLGYLTYFEENLLTSEMLVENGMAYEIALNNLIYNEDITIGEMVTGDVQAMSLALRSFSYGNNIELELNCEHCGKPSKASIPLTNFKMKSSKLYPDDNGEILLNIGKDGIAIKISPITFKQELEFLNKKEKLPLENLTIFVKEFNGERDPNKISRLVRSLRLLESRELRTAISENTPGVDTKYEHECEYCDQYTKYDFGGNTLDLLKLPSSYRNNLLEEIFLLTYYGKSITIGDAKQMSTLERKWMINRISEELEKQREAEKREMAKAKSKSKR